MPGLFAMLALAACGTRLPDKDFNAGQQQVITGPGGVTSTTGPNGVVPTVSGLPSAGPSGSGAPNGTGNGNGGGRGTPVAGKTPSDLGAPPHSITIGTLRGKTKPLDPPAVPRPAVG